jgi:hypothetical protein
MPLQKLIQKLSFLKKLSFLALFFLLLLPTMSQAESPEVTLTKFKGRQSLIEVAANKFSIHPRYLIAIIYVERTLNYDWTDDAWDVTLAKVEKNSSIGFAQIKIKTAYFIEQQLQDPTSPFYPGKPYENFLPVSNSPKELILKRTNDSLNILYAAAYLRLMQSRWEKAGFPLDQRPDILGTLYSAGLFNNDGTERKPNANPKPNAFGKQVEEALKFIR